MLNAFFEGLWYGALVLLGGSLWPVVLIHAATNASVRIGAASFPGFHPSAANYAIATAAELPLAIAGLGLLMRRSPGSIPSRNTESARQAASGASPIARALIVLSLTGVLLLAGCTEQAASTPMRTPHPPPVIETQLTPDEGAAICPFGQSQTPDGRVLEGNGVIPDVEVALDREQLLQGIDAQLEEAIEYAADQIGK